ncbi:hypothetical protein Dda_0931 [Drechslerella dactyloides]|uniref:DUF2423 domain-containing protein n=1 Tax=Drechslerella dactyloides TaxID=74499 RepID=A0AAD6J5E5_DREDA|nr:hypothetical protein Dda_0931 [Drechslerella dactyloides]
MAKSARASSKKAARSRIRTTVYAPVEHARLERLSARLMASIAQSSTPRTPNADQMEEDGKSPLPIRAASAEKADRRHRRRTIEKRKKRKAVSRGLSRTASAVSGLGHLHPVMESESANVIAPDLDLGDAANRQEQHTEDQAFKAAHQGNLFFDLPLPLSLVDEDSSGDESEDEAFYRAIGLFGDIQGFGMDNTLRVCLT